MVSVFPVFRCSTILHPQAVCSSRPPPAENTSDRGDLSCSSLDPGTRDMVCCFWNEQILRFSPKNHICATQAVGVLSLSRHLTAGERGCCLVSKTRCSTLTPLPRAPPRTSSGTDFSASRVLAQNVVDHVLHSIREMHEKEKLLMTEPFSDLGMFVEVPYRVVCTG